MAQMSEKHPTMREDQEVELLSRVDLFESLSKEEIRVLIRQNFDVRLGRGETFYAPWEQGGKLFILAHWGVLLAHLSLASLLL